jgi:hypothetical protein
MSTNRIYILSVCSYYTFETFDNNLKVFQAGSTVATSLIEDECKEKQAGLLTITTGAVEF